MANSRLLFADFHNHSLPGMLDGPQFTPEASAALDALREAGVCRVLLTPTYRPFFTSVRRFCQRRDEAWRKLKGHIPRDMTVKVGALLALEPEACASPELSRLALPGSDYLMLELPLQPFADWMDYELHLLLHKRHLKPIFASFERCVLLYPEDIVSRLMTVPGAAYQFGVTAAANERFLPIIKKLIRQNKPVLLGTGANLPAQKFPQLGDDLSAIQALLGKSAYISLLRTSYYFGPFLSSLQS